MVLLENSLHCSVPLFLFVGWHVKWSVKKGLVSGKILHSLLGSLVQLSLYQFAPDFFTQTSSKMVMKLTTTTSQLFHSPH